MGLGGYVGQPVSGGGHHGQLPLSPFTTGLLPLHILQGAFCQKEVKQSHGKDTQRPSFMHTLLYNF